MIVLSDEGENEVRNLPGSEFNTTELDLPQLLSSPKYGRPAKERADAEGRGR